MVNIYNIDMNKLNLFVGIIILMYKEGIVLSQFFADITLLDCGNFCIYERFKYRKKEKKIQDEIQRKMQKYKE